MEQCATATPRQFQSWGSEAPQILFVLPDLTQKDIEARRLLADASVYNGLNAAMIAAGFPEDWATSVARFSVQVRCPGVPSRQQQDMCRDLLLAEIAQYRPKVVVTLGTNGYGKLIGKKSQTLSRGRVKYLPAELKMNSKTHEGEPVLLTGLQDIKIMQVATVESCLVDPGRYEYLFHDFAKLPKIIDGTYAEKTSFEGRNYHLVYDFEWAKEILQYYRDQPFFSYDIETGAAPYGLEPYSKHSKILCISFSTPDRTAHCIPLHHKDNPFLDRVDELLPYLRDCLMGSANVGGWNRILFDDTWLLSKYGILPSRGDDQMLQHGLIDEGKPHTLKERAEIDTDLGYYDDELVEHFVDSKGKLPSKYRRCYETQVPLDVLLRYCCADADAAEQLRWVHYERLKAAGLWNYYQTFTLPDAHSTAETMAFGVAIDTDHRAVMAREVQGKIQVVEEKLYQDPQLMKWTQHRAGKFNGEGRLFWNDGYIWTDYNAYLRSDTPLYSEQHQAPYDQAAYNNLIENKMLRKFKGKVGLPKNKRYTLADLRLNFGSPTQLQEFLFDPKHLGLRSTVSTKKGGKSTDEGVLKSHAVDHPVLDTIVEWRKLQKWKSTYLDPVCNGVYIHTKTSGATEERVGWLKDDGLCHPKFLMTGDDRGQDKKKGGKGTVTGRKSCVEPNLQNQKSRGEGAKEIKRYFVSRWKDIGGKIMQADFSQLELRLFAVIAGVRWMIERYQQGADLHLELAMELFGATKEECLANGKYLRACAKEFWFGPIYGESARGIRDQLEKKMQLIWTLEQAEDALNRMYQKMPEYDAYKDGNARDLSEGLCGYTVFGRRRYLPTWRSSERALRSRALRQLGNFKIQSPGSDMTSYAWLTLNNWSREAGIKSRIVCSVHDSILWDIYPGEETLVMGATKYVMENLPFRIVKESPIPFKADLEIGETWGDMDEQDAAVSEQCVVTAMADHRCQGLVAWSDKLVA